MKNIYKLLFLLLLSLFIISCQDDDELNNPKIWLGNGTGFIHQDTTVLAALDTFEVQLIADKGTEEFVSLDFLRNNTVMKITNNPFLLEINGFENTYIVEDNSISLEGMDKSQFTTKWKIVVPQDNNKYHKYFFRLKNKKGEEISTYFTIKILE